jgi:hypothetical protein
MEVLRLTMNIGFDGGLCAGLSHLSSDEALK